MKTMFVMITIICLVLGLVVRPAEQQKQAVAALRELSVISSPNYEDVTIVYDFEPIMYDFEIEHETAVRVGSQLVGMRVPPVPESSKPGPTWLRVLIGIDYFADVEHVALTGPQFRDHDLRHLRHFSKLDSLFLWRCESITEVGVGHLTKLNSLTVLNINLSPITTLPAEIGQFTKLTDLLLSGNELTTLPEEIGQLANLTDLDLSLNQLTKLPAEIGKLTKLARLELGGNPITDADLVHLKSLKNLESVGLRETKVTKEGVADLKRALPNCDIKSDF